MSEPVEIVAFVTGPFATNSYLVGGGAGWSVIDPGPSPVGLVGFLGRRRIVPERIVLTHGHCDHIAGIPEIRSAVGDVPVWCPAGDAGMLTDAELNLSAPFGLPFVVSPPEALFECGQTLELGASSWRVLDTSGHTAGGVSLYCPEAGAVFTGDALFAEGIGRTDFPGGDAARLVGNIRGRLLSLPAETRVYPGHGPATTIGQERRWNPFLGGV